MLECLPSMRGTILQDEMLSGVCRQSAILSVPCPSAETKRWELLLRPIVPIDGLSVVVHSRGSKSGVLVDLMFIRLWRTTDTRFIEDTQRSLDGIEGSPSFLAIFHASSTFGQH